MFIISGTNLVKGKDIPGTGCGGPLGCEASRLSHFLDSWLTDGGQVVSLMLRPPFTPRKIPDTHFCYKLSRPQRHSTAGRIRWTENSNDLIRNQTRNLPACSIVLQPTRLLCAPWNKSGELNKYHDNYSTCCSSFGNAMKFKWCKLSHWHDILIKLQHAPNRNSTVYWHKTKPWIRRDVIDVRNEYFVITLVNELKIKIMVLH
jgi:hypothetical protein